MSPVRWISGPGERAYLNQAKKIWVTRILGSIAWMRRRVAAVVLAVLAVGVSSGCTPRPQSRLALRNESGSIEAVIHVCPNDAISRLSVANPDNGDTWAVKPSGRPAAVESQQVVVVPVLTTPEGWKLAEDSLGELAWGRRYRLAAGMLRTRPALVFRPRDLDHLGGEVLVGRDRATVSMREDEFHREAARSCRR